MSVGKGTDIEALGPIPSNFIVKNYVPQPNILEKVCTYHIESDYREFNY